LSWRKQPGENSLDQDPEKRALDTRGPNGLQDHRSANGIDLFGPFSGFKYQVFQDKNPGNRSFKKL